jgi:hypothetical protein
MTEASNIFVREANLDGIARRRRGGDLKAAWYQAYTSIRGALEGDCTTDLFCPSTGLPACLRAPSRAFPPALGLNCCLLEAAAPLRPASPFAVAVDMAAGVAEERVVRGMEG